MSFRRFIVPISLIAIGFLPNPGIAQTNQTEQGIIFYTNVTPTTTPQDNTIPDAFTTAVIKTSEDCTCNDLINNQSLHFTIFHPPVPEDLNCSSICQTLSQSSNPFTTLYELLNPVTNDQTENFSNRPEDAFAEPSPTPEEQIIEQPIAQPTAEPIIEQPIAQPTIEPTINTPTPTPYNTPAPSPTPTQQISSQHQQCTCTVTLGQQTFTRTAHEIFSPPIPMDQCNQARCIQECSSELLMEISSN